MRVACTRDLRSFRLHSVFHPTSIPFIPRHDGGVATKTSHRPPHTPTCITSSSPAPIYVCSAATTTVPAPPFSPQPIGVLSREQLRRSSAVGRSMADAAAGKAQVAREVCAASAAFASCPHRRRSPRRPHFVDWYLVLAIGEAASEEAIKRRYRQLALQLHPDKNRHPKAEVAFKLVSEAQACLTDKARRRAFDAERSTAFCAACHARLTTTAARHRASGDKKKSTPASAPSAHQHHQQRRRPTTTQALREVQNRLRDECRIIDDCLRANNGHVARRRRQSFPLFDPSDQHRFPDYPHARPPPPVTPFARCQQSDEELGMGWDQRWCRGGSCCCESPVFQVKTAPERAARTTSPW